MSNTKYVCKCGYQMTAMQKRNARGEKCPDCRSRDVNDMKEQKA
jgi:DNA-directed RNA polymerase subunit RPC12/RpoP